MGDSNASIPTPQPVMHRKMFGALGRALNETCYTFMTKLGIQENVKRIWS